MSQVEIQIKRMAPAGAVRLFLAVIAALTISLAWILLLATILPRGNSELVTLLLVLSFAAILVLVIFSQLGKGRWALLPSGIKEDIVARFPLIPFSFARSRFVAYGEISDYVLRQYKNKAGKTVILEISILGAPGIRIPRLSQGIDPGFDTFIEKLREHIGEAS